LLEGWGWFYLVKFIRKKVFGIGITAGVIIGAIFLAQRFNIGGKIAEGFGGLGAFLPNIAKTFVSGFAEETGGLGEEAVKVSENFQRALAGGLLFSEQEQFGGGGFVGGTVTEQTLSTIPGGDKFPTFLKNAFAAFDPGLSNKNIRSTTKKPDPENVFNVAKAFTPIAQQSRIQKQEIQKPTTGITSSAFGGFSSATGQESALQKAIAKSRQLNPQFFNV